MRPYIVKVKSVEDLVNVAAASQLTLVHRVTIEGDSNLLFVSLPFYDSAAIYYCEVNSDLRGKYILFNRFTGEVSLSNEYVSDSKYVLIPVIGITEWQLLPKELLERVECRKKKERKVKKRRIKGQEALKKDIKSLLD